MSERPVLIVSASAGNGHARAAEALCEAFARAGQPAEHLDVLSLAPRLVKSVYGGGFELLARRAPRVWREIYARSDGPADAPARWGPYAAQVLFREFRRLLRSQPWSHCVCTHFLPAQLAAGLASPVPFSLVVTDYTLHRYWAQPRVRSYFAPNVEVATALRQRLPGARVEITGIPVGGMCAEQDELRARSALGLTADLPIVLLAGGGLGIGIEASVAAALDAVPADAQLVAACGRNEAAAARLRALGIPSSRLRVFGYVAGLEQMLAAADVVVTKPGGLTTSEALALGRPLVLTRPIPGHEDGNVRYLTQHGAALSASSDEELRGALAAFFSDANLRFRMAVAARGLGRPDAAARVVAAIGIDSAARSVA